MTAWLAGHSQRERLCRNRRAGVECVVMSAASVSASPRRAVSARPAMAHIRWDRVGRLAMLAVLVAIAYLYLSAAFSLYSSWRESKRDSAQVAALEREDSLLMRQHAVLVSKGTLQTEARKLGMIRPGDLGYVVSGLPQN